MKCFGGSCNSATWQSGLPVQCVKVCLLPQNYKLPPQNQEKNSQFAKLLLRMLVRHVGVANCRGIGKG